MKREHRYGLNSLDKDFPNEDACLDFVFHTLHSQNCSCGGTYKRIAGRKQYQCSKCRFQIAPTSGTIFHKSDTPLRLWFRALLAFSNAKSGISAKQLERELEVTYKTAYRILKYIRKALEQDKEKLTGDVEVDVGFFRAGKKLHKVTAAVSRNGKARLSVVPEQNREAMSAFIEMNLDKDALLITDKAKAFLSAGQKFKHLSVNHSSGEYAWDRIHINHVETLFSHLKRSIRGTFKAISSHELQAYLDAFVFLYNNRHSDKERFGVLLGKILPS